MTGDTKIATEPSSGFGVWGFGGLVFFPTTMESLQCDSKQKVAVSWRFRDHGARSRGNSEGREGPFVDA